MFSSTTRAATALTAEQALKSLQDGQARFLAGKPAYPESGCRPPR